ncbi:helix-turn-helix domain-containing protein [Xylanimonas sp. McL0601]|uniref:helix-turn-helix domain-containing protein n=1 Tax=Xylanimonas sp. McL0601 TaxID=3414739 RepID=UPI003CF49721
MAHTHLTIRPEDVRRSAAAGMPGWLDRLADFVREAASSGETVTVTSRRRMMTPEEVADSLGVSRSTISRRIKAGEISAVRVGNRNRIPYAEFERYSVAANRRMLALVVDEIDSELIGDE